MSILSIYKSSDWKNNVTYYDNKNVSTIQEHPCGNAIKMRLTSMFLTSRKNFIIMTTV